MITSGAAVRVTVPRRVVGQNLECRVSAQWPDHAKIPAVQSQNEIGVEVVGQHHAGRIDDIEVEVVVRGADLQGRMQLCGTDFPEHDARGRDSIGQLAQYRISASRPEVPATTIMRAGSSHHGCRPCRSDHPCRMYPRRRPAVPSIDDAA
ncbi:hypothetical protein [Nocardia otitidiscaviarum]|uniref:hypothetical protein n=1 Tax=Nocardia otitidiscaviarum TaxID=1823 RepID=UPI001896232A|nr:hypothetical protein [Nocardia otitidiscaviarum]MBF6179204.1 hypothetical protein [Nocardia otitidiscaviarum]